MYFHLAGELKILFIYFLTIKPWHSFIYSASLTSMDVSESWLVISSSFSLPAVKYCLLFNDWWDCPQKINLSPSVWGMTHKRIVSLWNIQWCTQVKQSRDHRRQWRGNNSWPFHNESLQDRQKETRGLTFIKKSIQMDGTIKAKGFKHCVSIYNIYWHNVL